MTFLNAILLAGVPSFLIPLLIHLLNKRRVSTVRWGAMHLLQEVIQQRKRRLNIEQWLLLAVRIAIPVTLALCLARPALTALRTLGNTPTSLVLLLDDSFSMRAPSASGSPAEQARQDIRRILEAQPKGSDAHVLLIGGRTRPLLDQPTRALDLLNQPLSEIVHQSGPVSPNDALQSAIATVQQSANGARELVLVSDFQASDWQAVADGASLPALDSLLQQTPAPQITFYQIAGDLNENLSIASVDLSAQVVAVDQPIGMRVRVKNHGQRPWQDVAVHLEADGTRLRTARVSLAPSAEAVLNFSHAFDQTGDHSLAVRLEGDSFADDNAFYSIVQVRDQVSILLVDGDPGTVPLGGATDFLKLALAPYQSANATLKDLIHTTQVDVKRLREADLKGKEVVVLADVERLPNQRLNELRQFVSQGGGLLIFAGPHCDINWYNREFYQEGDGPLPATIGGLRRANSPAQPARIHQQRFTHPTTVYFNDARAGRLRDAEFQTWLEWLPSADGRTSTILQLDQNSPLFIEHTWQRGRVIACATTADAEWTNLPLQPFFVPLMQRLVTYLAASNTPNAWQPVGEPIRLTLPKGTNTTEFHLRLPDGQSLTILGQVETDQIVLTSPSPLPGIYHLSQNATPTRLFARNLDPAESNLAPLPPERVQKIAARYQAAYANNFDSWQEADRTRRHGNELWRPLLLALLGLLFLEVLLQQRLARS